MFFIKTLLLFDIRHIKLKRVQAENKKITLRIAGYIKHLSVSKYFLRFLELFFSKKLLYIHAFKKVEGLKNKHERVPIIMHP